MADITLNTQTIGVLRTQSSVYGARAEASGSSASADPAPTAASVGLRTTVTATIAADVLLAAQQSREPDRARGFDVRSAYDRAALNAQEERDPRDPAADRIVTDDAPNDTAQPSGSAGSPQPDTFGSALGDNVVRLFTGNTRDDQSAVDAAAARDRADYVRANQAYVGAGAADGLTFARAGVDTSLRPQSAGFDVLI